MKIQCSAILLALSLLAPAFLRAEETNPIFLWPKDAPGSKGKTAAELVEKGSNGERKVSSIHRPSITPYLPARENSTGIAVIIAPGGAHRFLAIDHEGYNVAKFLSDRGIAAFVLKYRLAKETNSTYEIKTHAFADAQRAIRVVRSRARDWNINPDRIGIMGFSAGGELAAMAGTQFDEGIAGAADPTDHASSRPAFQVLIYPGRSGDIQPTTNSVPVFLACAYNDRPDISEGLAEVYLRFKKVKVPAELHIYSDGGHGFGLRESNRKPVGNWAARFEEWLKETVK
jgi:acetyl esterase/lipase